MQKHSGENDLESIIKNQSSCKKSCYALKKLHMMEKHSGKNDVESIVVETRHKTRAGARVFCRCPKEVKAQKTVQSTVL